MNMLNTTGTNLLTKCHEDLTIKVASRPYNEICPSPGCHVFQPTGTIFKLVLDIIGTNLTKCNEDRVVNVASRVLTRKMLTPDKRRKQNLTMSKLCLGELKPTVPRQTAKYSAKTVYRWGFPFQL
ncbi:hypothetical protein DPMN_009092 [Dreissena polymorpha]|uniref:Uncharacterized protein n=1 Tax=Dreissena polymorpha TaxID=45954 RepID=A0A9D4RZU0_DREPO|nr:hypothetical protein DPMN_009092 [Dreissena polymorpha]